MSFRKKMFIGITLAAAVWTVLTTGEAQAQASNAEITRLTTGADENGPSVDYSDLSRLYRAIVLDVGYSDRRTASRRTPITTGSLIPVASSSRYRYEGNRVVYHLMEDIHVEALNEYVALLEALPSQTSLTQLSDNEQLAYWLNLHNAALVRMTASVYPVRRLDRADIDGVAFFDAPAVNVDGVALSLNDIRFRIVQASWDDPRIIYGFHLGAVGGPSLADEAFEGRRVWTQLESNAREFVTALRGVDTGVRRTEISPVYEWHAALFDGVEDLKNHLRTFADSEVAELIDRIGSEPAYLDFDWSISDMTNGRNGCSGSTAGLNIQVTTGGGSTSNAIECQTLPPQAADLLNVVIERRLEFLRAGDLGRVTIRDIETSDTGGEDEDSEITVNLPSPD